MATISNYEYFDVFLDVSEKDIGINICGGINSSNRNGNIDIYLTEIMANGAAKQDGRLLVGDILLKVNGISFDHVTPKEAVQIIANAGKYIHFYVKRSINNDNDDTIDRNDSIIDGTSINECNEDEPLIMKSEDDSDTNISKSSNLFFKNTIQIRLERSRLGFGLNLIGGIGNELYLNDTGIYITDIIIDSPAYQNKQIQIGDQLVAINDINLENISFKQALYIIRNSPAISIFTIRQKISWE